MAFVVISVLFVVVTLVLVALPRLYALRRRRKR